MKSLNIFYSFTRALLLSIGNANDQIIIKQSHLWKIDLRNAAVYYQSNEHTDKAIFDQLYLDCQNILLLVNKYSAAYSHPNKQACIAHHHHYMVRFMSGLYYLEHKEVINSQVII